MKRVHLALAVLLLVVSLCFASTPVTIDDTAGGVAIAPATSTAEFALISVELAPIRYEYDGTAPTASSGHPVSAGGTFTIIGTDAIRAFRAIRTTGVSAVLTVTLR